MPILAEAKPLNDAEVIDLLHNGIVVPIQASEEQVMKQLGSPVQITSENILNPYAEIKDEVIHYIYPSLEII